MKLRDKVLYMSFGAGLVVLGMVLNSFLVDDADAQDSSLRDITGSSLRDMTFRDITCETITIKYKNKNRGYFGLDSYGDAILKIYGDDDKTVVAYLGENANANDEMMFQLLSKSKTDRREATMMIDENGGRLDCFNKIGKRVVTLGVGDKGGGGVDLRDKHGYVK